MAISRKDLFVDEHSEQVALMDWWNTVAGEELAPLLMAIPNGGKRGKATAARLQAEGVRPGVPDLFLAIPANGHHGLWIEMKRSQGGRVGPDQKAMHELLRRQGYKVEVCHGWTKAMLEISGYLAEVVTLRNAAIGGSNGQGCF